MKIKKITLFILILLLFIGVSFATENNNHTTNNHTTNLAKDTNQNINNIVKKDNNNEIKKQTTENNTKTYNANTYKTLNTVLTSNKYSNVKINITNNIKLTNNIQINEKIKKLVIEGNKKTINGDNKHEFITIPQKTTITINNLKLIQCNSTTDNGTIYNTGKLTINKCTLNNNNGIPVGVINNEGNLTIKNSTINNNQADIQGGAIINRGNMIIQESIINNNTVKNADIMYNNDGGGAIYNVKNITIKNSELNYNKVLGNYGYGGAIFNIWGSVTITNSTIKHNTANDGGAIKNTWGDLNITKSNISNNKAKNYGGAVYNMYYFADITISDTVINNNKATRAGAIYNMISDDWEMDFYNYEGKMLILNSSFKKNTASSTGGAIYNSGLIKIRNSIFLENNAKNNSHDIENTHKLIILNSQFSNKTKSITNYDIIITPKNAKTINKIKNKNKGKIIYLTKLYKNEKNFTYLNKLVHSGKTVLKLNYNIKLDVYNDEEFIFMDGIKINQTKINMNGNYHTINPQGFRIFEIRENTSISNVKFINGHEYSGGAILNFENLNLKSCTFNNNKASYDGGAIYNFGSINITNSKFNNNNADWRSGAINNRCDLFVKNSVFNNNSAVMGGAISNDYSLTYDIIHNEFINNHAYKGSAIYNDAHEPFKSEKIIQNNAFVNNSGNKKSVIYTTSNELNNVSNNYFDEETKNVKISVNKIGNTRYGNNVTVKGKIVSIMGKVVKNVTVRIRINDKTFKVKTDNKGIFKYVTRTTKIGTNNIIVRFPGNKDFNTKTMKASFKVIKQNVKISINKINNIKRGKSIVITGKFTNPNGKVFANCILKVRFNKKTVSVKTDKNGVYTYKTKASLVGTNNVSVTFNANKYYNACTAKRSFKVTR